MGKHSAKDRKILTELLSDPQQYRKTLRENQVTFWSRFAIGQSGGSRYELGRNMPEPVAMLCALYALGYVSDSELREIRELIAEVGGGQISEQTSLDVVRPRLRTSAAQRAEDAARPQSRSARGRGRVLD